MSDTQRARAWRDGVQVGGTVLLLVAVWFAVDSESLLHALAGARPGPLLLALLLTLPMLVLSALRWQRVAVALRVPLPLKEAVGEYYGASLLNSVLPGGVAGDVVRVFRHRGRLDPMRARALRPLVHAVLLERGFGQAALLAVLLLGIVLLPDGPLAAHALTVLLGILVLLAVGVTMMVRLGKRRGPTGRVARALTRDTRRALRTPLDALYHLTLSLAISLCYVAAFWLAVQAIDSEAALDFRHALQAVPLVLLAMLIPVSVGGLGLREAAAAALWPLIGIPAHEGAAAALLYGLVMLLGSLPGLLCWIPWTTGRRSKQITASRTADAGAATSSSKIPRPPCR